jgi:HEPN domain-containing protein
MENLTIPSPDGLSHHVIPKFFEDYPTEIIEQKLWNFCGARLFMAPPDENTTAALHFYEDLVHVLHHVKQWNGQLEAIPPAVANYALGPMAGIVNLITQAIPVGMIYNLSKSEEKIDLIIVLERSCTKAYSDFENVIDLVMLGHEYGTCTIHNYGLLNAQVNNGHLFYSLACVEENLVYRKNTEEAFRTPNEETIAVMQEKSAILFNTGLQKAISFYDGAQYYLDGNNLEMAMFMLHQACELTYRCLLNVLRGKDLKCHSPGVLRKHLKRFAPEVIGVFSEFEEEELYYLQLLEDGYIKSRYELSYTVEKESLIFLNEKVGLLQDKARMIGLRF